MPGSEPQVPPVLNTEPPAPAGSPCGGLGQHGVRAHARCREGFRPHRTHTGHLVLIWSPRDRHLHPPHFPLLGGAAAPVGTRFRIPRVSSRIPHVHHSQGSELRPSDARTSATDAPSGGSGARGSHLPCRGDTRPQGETLRPVAAAGLARSLLDPCPSPAHARHSRSSRRLLSSDWSDSRRNVPSRPPGGKIPRWDPQHHPLRRVPWARTSAWGPRSRPLSPQPVLARDAGSWGRSSPSPLSATDAS